MHTPVSRDFTGQLIFLGTGTSVGVPVIGCDCATCTSDDPRNHRTRCALALGLPEGNLLIDTPPDLRTQLLREKIGLAHAVLYTHAHADHLFGLDDVRLFPYYLGQKLPLYCEEHVERSIRQAYSYAFVDDETAAASTTSLPRLVCQRVTTEPFDLLGTRFTPIRLKHGRFDVLGFRFGDIAYCTDVNEIPAESWPLLAGLDVLILDCLRPKPHPTHLSFDEAVDVARRIGAKRTYMTHLSHFLEHGQTSRNLPDGMEPAYDGLVLPLGLVKGIVK